MSCGVVSDIQARAESERLYVWYSQSRTKVVVRPGQVLLRAPLSALSNTPQAPNIIIIVYW